MSEERHFEVVVPPNCEVGDAEARALVKASLPAGEIVLSRDLKISVRTSSFCPTDKAYVIEPARLEEPVIPWTFSDRSRNHV